MTVQSRLIERIASNFVQTGVRPSGRVSGGQYDLWMRVWIDLTNTAHVLVLRPLVERLEAAGHEVELTARPLSHTLELLDDWGHPYVALGRHGGAGRAGKALAAASRVPQLFRFVRGRGFRARLRTDRPTCHPSRARSASPTRRCSTTNGRRSSTPPTAGSRTVSSCPTRFPAERLARYGARPPKLVQYPGLKEEYYLSDFEPDERVLEELGVHRDRPLAVVRTAPSYALYLGGSESSLLRAVLERLAAGARKRSSSRRTTSSGARSRRLALAPSCRSGQWTAAASSPWPICSSQGEGR